MKVVNRIVPASALFLASIAVMPVVMKAITGADSLVIGGTGLLIIISVIIESVNQINSQLTMRDYESL